MKKLFKYKTQSFAEKQKTVDTSFKKVKEKMCSEERNNNYKAAQMETKTLWFRDQKKNI